VSADPGISCRQFDDAVDQLAVGALVEPERTALLSHAAACPGCEARLNELSGLADRLLLLVPEVEPPAGFEAGVLARMGHIPSSEDRGTAPVRAGHRWRWVTSAAAVVAAVVLVGSGLLVGRAVRQTRSAEGAIRSGEIVTSSGDRIGVVGMYSRPVPYVLMSLYEPPQSGLLSCELETRGGRMVVVGWWDYKDLQDGVWATGIDRSLTDAVMMRILDQNKTVVATAALTASGGST
jgi:hypothetical protein